MTEFLRQQLGVLLSPFGFGFGFPRQTTFGDASVSPFPPNMRVLEDDSPRVIEDGSYRVTEA